MPEMFQTMIFRGITADQATQAMNQAWKDGTLVIFRYPSGAAPLWITHVPSADAYEIHVTTCVDF
jgi:hypothetical protein